MNSEKLEQIRNHQLRNPSKFEMLFRSKLTKWNIKYIRQQIICGYIADFYLPQFGLVIEIDGAAHYQYNLRREINGKMMQFGARDFKCIEFVTQRSSITRKKI